MAKRPIYPILAGTAATFVLAACAGGFDPDLRSTFNGFDTTSSVRQATEPRPRPDDRGIISYPNYQVAVARRGDTVGDVAARVGISADELARYNGLPADVSLRGDEVLALPRRVSEPSVATGAISAGPIQPDDGIDITTLAGDAINRAGPVSTAPRRTQTGTSGREPLRHKVERGETAYSISRLYNISVRSLADWNGLDGNLTVREGQYLLIPVAVEANAAAATTISRPGAGSQTPQPPSSVKPLPKPIAVAPQPNTPKLGGEQTAASASRLAAPVDGKIIRAFVAKKNDGIDIAAAAGTTVQAADAGVVAAITEDTDQVPILVLRHADNLLTVYANIDGIKVKKGAKVKRGQALAVVRNGSPSFLHFEVRQGFDAVDPVPLLN